MSFVLPAPPDPSSSQYQSNPLAYNRAVFDWMVKVKGRLEQSAVLNNGIPIAAAQIGDMPYKASAAWARLPAGIAGQILTQTGTGTTAAPAWGNISANLAVGSGIAISGTGTDTIGLAGIAPGDLLANLGTATAAPTASTLTALIDKAIASTQGDILYRGTSVWGALPPGTNGQFLQTLGTSSNPQWAATPKFKTSTFTIDVSTTGTQTVSGVGFTPKGVAFLGTVNGAKVLSLGVDDGTNHNSIGTLDYDSADSWEFKGGSSIDIRPAAGVQHAASVNSFNNDGFTINKAVSGSPTGTATLIYLAIG